MKRIKRILVPTDFSLLSVAATEYAKTLAKAFRARLCLVHVVERPVVIGEENINLAYVRLWPELEEAARQDLKKFALKNLRGVPHLEIQLLTGNPYYEIVRLAQDGGFDLIVLATHGRTGLAHVLIGSVAERVARHSPIPVLLVKPQEMRK
jgi:nucleotide-binding universal stress UspA family protein